MAYPMMIINNKLKCPEGTETDQASCTQSPCPCRRPLLIHCSSTGDTQTQFWLSLCGVSEPWCAQGFVWALQGSLSGMGFDSKWNVAPHTIFLGLILCPRMWGIFYHGIQHSPVTLSCNFGVLPGENEGTSFYSAILYGNLWSESHNTEWGFPRELLVLGKTESRGMKGQHW